MMPKTFRKLLWLWPLLVAASCDLTREESLATNATVSWAPRLTDAQGGASVPKVDRVQLLVTLNDGSNRNFNQSASWNTGSIKIDGIPANVPFTATVKGLMNDGSLVWSGNSQVGAGSGSAELTSAVAVTTTVGAGIKLDSAALRPTGSQLARVYVVNWPFADNGLRLLYTTDGSDPMPSNGSTRTYAGPFTLSGSGKLRLRQYRDGNVGVEAISSAILEQGYQSSGWQGCSLPDFSLPSGAVGGTSSMSVGLGGSTSAGCELHYRLDGVTPTLTDPVWSAAGIALGNGTTHVMLKALPGSLAAMMPSPVAEGSWQCSSCIATVSNISASQTFFTISSEDTIQLPLQLIGSNPGITWALDSGSDYGSLVPHDLYATFKAGNVAATAAASSSTVRITATLNGTGQKVTFRVTINARVATQTLQIIDSMGSASLDRYPMGNGSLRLEARYGTVPVGSALWSVASQPSGSTFSLNSSGASAWFLPSQDGDYELHAKVGQDLAITRVHWSGLASAVTMTAMGNQMVSIRAGTQAQLNVSVTGAVANTNVVWNIENAGMGSLLPTGTSCSYQAPPGLATATVTYVRATLRQNGAATTQSVLFTINVQPTVESIASSGATVYALAPEERKQLMVTTVPTNAAVQWTLVGTSTGTVDPYNFYCYYQAPTVAELGTPPRQMTVRASLVSDPSRFVDFSIDVQPKPLVFRDNDAKEDTSYAVPSGTLSFYLEAWKGTARATGAQWRLIDRPATAVLPTWTTDASGSILFNAAQDGIYRFEVVDGGYVSTVAIRWGVP